MSSGGVLGWSIFGRLNAPPPPLLAPSAPTALAGLVQVDHVGVSLKPRRMGCLKAGHKNSKGSFATSRIY